MDDSKISHEFEKIWKKIGEIEKLINQETLSQTTKPNREDSLMKIKQFCKDLDITEERLRTNIDFQTEMPRLMILPKEKTRTKTQYLSLITLGLLYRKIYKKSISDNDILELFRFSRVPIERMDKLYESPMFKKFFTRVNGEIKFSWDGEKEAERIIKSLVNDERNNPK